MKQSVLVGVAISLTMAAGAMAQGTAMKFDCGVAKGATALSAKTLIPEGPMPAAGTFGFDLKTVPASFTGGACASDKPFFFSVTVPDGNYKVTVVLGGPGASVTTLKGEARRLLLLEKQVAAKASDTEEFVLNVRTAPIAGSKAAADGTPGSVKLKSREIGAMDWDGKLTLEFNGEHPAVRSISVVPVTDVPTVYIAGDSTVVDQDKEPWAAWGQMLPAFVTSKVAISNQAESGETIKSFQGERRFEKIFSTIKAGDYLMIQFNHNDQKAGGGFVSIDEYKALMRKYIAMAKEKGATTILVTAMNRRVFDDAGKIRATLGDYPDAVRAVAKEDGVMMIDLNAMSKTLFEAMGPDGTLKAFVHYPADTFPNQAKALADDTHFNAYGAYELARAMVQDMQRQKLPLAAYLRKDITPFDAGKPDALASFKLPASPTVSAETPYGR